MSKPASVQSVSRALNLLTILGKSDDGQRVSDIARQADLAVSTAHRLLTTLEQHGFAQFDPDNALWHVGRQAYAVGAAYGRRRNFVAAALPFLRHLRDTTRETANLGILEDDMLVTVSQVESREIMRAISPPGGRVPAFCSGMGKAILSTWPDSDIAAYAARTGFRPLTTKSHRDLGQRHGRHRPASERAAMRWMTRNTSPACAAWPRRSIPLRARRSAPCRSRVWPLG